MGKGAIRSHFPGAARRCAAAVVCLALSGAAQGRSDNGMVLVAKPEINDPSFARTVVLVREHGHGRMVGIVLNRPTETRLAELFSGGKNRRRQSDRIFAGGPVAPNTLVFLARLKKPPPHTLHVFGDVHLGFDAGALEALLRRPESVLDLRVYRGYAGWTLRQFHGEIDRGDWHVLRADAGVVFSTDPEKLWSEMIRRTAGTTARHGTHQRHLAGVHAAGMGQ